MSHVAKIELQINDLDTLKGACNRLGLEFVSDQKTYAWYGHSVGDYALPEGFTEADLGKCDHAIRAANASYEIGVVKRNGKYILLWDFYRAGGLEAVIGKGAGRLKQAYGIERVHKEAKRKGYRVQETKMEKGIRLTLTV